jgi:hypothetical protein
MEYRAQLSGWQAAVVGLLVLGVVTYQCVARIQSVDDAGRETIRTWLVREYQGTGLRQEVRAYLQRKAGVPEQPVPPPSMPEPEVGLVSLSGHGSKDIMVVRVQVRVNNGPPPDDRPIRYVDLMRRTDGRWMVFAESDGLHYYWMLLLPALRGR